MKSRRADAPTEMTVHKAFTTSITDMVLNIGILAIVALIVWPK